MRIDQAVFDSVLENSPGITTDFHILKILSEIYKTGYYKESKIRIYKPTLSEGRFKRNRRKLLRNRYMLNHRNFGGGVYQLPGSKKQSVEEQCCFVDPFCYISHFSALQYYNLTNRSPTHLILTTPSPGLWLEKKRERIKLEFQNENFQKLGQQFFVRSAFHKRISGRPVIRHNSNYPGNPIKIRGTFGRISKIGRVFFDTLAQPDWCGGINHVLEVWINYAPKYQEEIVDCVSKSNNEIVKVRAGYIIEEVLNLQNEKVSEWRKFAQRGGSRKLDPMSPYSPKFSKNWMLSINV